MARIRALARPAIVLSVLCAAGTAGSVLAEPATPQFRMRVPEGFEDLAREQQAIVDVFMGGRQVATASVLFGPGELRFADPATLVHALPGVAARDKVLAALSASGLADNRALSCRERVDGAACQPLHPEVAAIVFDERRFRIELFVNPALLETRAAITGSYLPAPVGGLSLSQALGFTVAGATGTAAQLSLTDSVLVGLGPARLRADVGWQTDQYARADTLAVEVDRPNRRWSAGLFWAPGTELTGRRKLLGFSLATQFDTRLDRDQLQGTPLIIFLDERARVDTYVGGRLVSSGLFEAGNQALDTTGMPEGSYEVVLRITPARGSATGAAREERRMFTRSPVMPPLGHDSWLLAAGTLVDEGRGSSPLGAITRTPYVQAGWIHRLSHRLAAGLGLVATDARQMLHARALLVGRRITANANVMVSDRGDFGAYAHIGSQAGGRFSFDLNARAVSTRGGRPLLSEATPVRVWMSPQPQFERIGNHEAEFSGNVALQLGEARVALVGNWRTSDRQRQYAAGPSTRVPVLRRDGLELVARGDYAFTERGRSGYFGLSLILTRGNKSYSADGGLSVSPDPGVRSSAAVGNLRATVTGDTQGGQVQGSMALAHDQNTSYATGDVTVRGTRGELSASLGRELGGAGGTQYALTLRTGLSAARGYLALGRIDGGEAGIVARVEAAPDERFDLLVNEVPRASLRGGHSVAVDLPAYRTYEVRLRTAAGSLLGYDGSTRRVTLFPGNVAALAWRTRPQLAIYARLVGADGTPLAGASLSAGGNVAETDGDGGFVMQLDAERTIMAHLPNAGACAAVVPESAEHAARNGFASLKDLVCER